MSLPIDWVDKIFARLTVRFGNRFLDRWNGVDMDAVRFDWASVLDGFEQWPDAIKFAIENMDDEKPPTATMFRTFALKAPKPELLQLPEPKADPVRMAAALGKLEHVRNAQASPHGMKDWAYRLKARHDAGDKLNPNQIRCYQAALGLTA